MLGGLIVAAMSVGRGWWTADVPPPTPECASASTSAIGLRLSASPLGATTEVQSCLSDSEACMAESTTTFYRWTGEPTEAQLTDLRPARAHHFRVRDWLWRDFRWTPFSAVLTCSTATLRHLQVGGVRTDGEHELRSVGVRWDAPYVNASLPNAPFDAYAVELVRVREGSGLAGERALVHVPASHRRVRVQGLAPDAAYSVRVRAERGGAQGGESSGEPAGEWSDALLVRTATAGVRQRRVVRVSEFCADWCEPDYLSEHNSADSLADVAFLTEMSRLNNTAPIQLNLSQAVLTQYCLSTLEGVNADVDQPMRDADRAQAGAGVRMPGRTLLPAAGVRRKSGGRAATGEAGEQAAAGGEGGDGWAPYLSCDPVINFTQRCHCINAIDKSISRVHVRDCPANGIMPCACEPAAFARSLAAVGRMPVYLPFPIAPLCARLHASTARAARSCAARALPSARLPHPPARAPPVTVAEHPSRAHPPSAAGSPLP